MTALLGLAGGTGQQEIKNGMAEFAVALDRASVAAATRDIDARLDNAAPLGVRRVVVPAL